MGPKMIMLIRIRCGIWISCPDDFAEVADLTAKNATIKKQERRKGLVLCRGAYLLFKGKVGEEGVNLRFSHRGRMANMVKENKTFHPKAISLIGAPALMTCAQRLAKLI